jgi:polyisoprenoid-binding protein YceI
MTLRTSFLFLALTATPALAVDYAVTLKPDNTKVHFTLGDVLHTVNGTFALKSGTIVFSAESGKASGSVVVDVASGDSGSEARDKRMHANVLESAKYPEATFAPSKVEGALAIPGTSNVKVYGVFTIHGAAHDVTMDTRITATSDKLNATIQFDIPYVSWGMKDPSNFLLKVNKTAHLTIDIAAPLDRR